MKEKALPVAEGELIEVTAMKLVAGGDSIARVAGFPLFIPGLYPGDRAEVEVTEVRKGFGRARVSRLQEASSWRRAEPCPIAGECGGCSWTSLRLDRQLEAKREILMDSLQRVGKLDVHAIPLVRLHPSPLNYRLRSRLQVSADVDRSLGFFASRTNRVVPLVPECEVVGPEVIAHMEDLRRVAADSEITSIETFESGSSFAVAASPGDGVPVSIRVRGFDYHLSTAAFFQVNRHLLGTMIDLVLSLAGRTRTRGSALDLYAGVGFFTVPLGSIFEQVTGVESSTVSFRYGKVNTKSLSNVHMVRDNVERFLSSDPQADFVMLDPPRAGLASGVVEELAHLNASTICYLSCDPVTFSRDASRLGRHGWILRTLDLLDLFPNTHHIETLSSFVRER